MEGNIAASGCPLLKKSFIAAGQTILDVGGGVKPIAIAGIEATDLALVQIVSDDSGTTIALIEAVCTAGVLTITRTDDGTSADDAVVNYFVLRVQ